MSAISKIINIVLFIAYTVLAVWIGYHFGNKKTIPTVPSISTFFGKPDSTKATPVPVPDIRDVVPHVSKPDSVKPDTAQPQILYQLDTVHTLSIPKSKEPACPVGKYASYKTFSDSLGDYAIKVLAKFPVDSVFLSVHHFSMQTVEIPDKLTWFEYGFGSGILAAIIVAILIVK
jgi:hypothetical protein